MKRWLKRIGLIFLALVGLLIVVVLAIYGLGVSRFNQSHDVSVAQFDLPADPESIARGEHLVTAVAHCGYCHGPQLAGDFVENDPGTIGVIVAPNLTAGKGGLGATYTVADWVRAIRHGVSQKGRSVILMPSLFFDQISQDDLSAMIAYLQSIPAVDNVLPETKLSFLSYVLIGLGPLTEGMSALHIDHEAPFSPSPAENDSAEYGGYLVEIAQCRACHGFELAGGQVCSSCPIGPNLTPGGGLGSWTSEDFLTALRTGENPSGGQIDDYMPWEHFRNMTDTELKAIWAYLGAQPALETQIP